MEAIICSWLTVGAIIIIVKIFGLIHSVTNPIRRPMRKISRRFKAMWNKSWLKRKFRHFLCFLEDLFWHTLRSKYRPKRPRKRNKYTKRYYIRSSKRKSHRIACKQRTFEVLPPISVFTSTTKLGKPVPFDPGSFIIAIDNCASRCMTNNLKDLIDKKPCRVPVKGLGTSTGTYKGTVKWKWQDDQGRTFLFEIPNVIYVKDLPFRVLSPQCWSRTLAQKAICITEDYDIIMSWEDGKHVRTVPLDTNSNVGMMQSAPDYKSSAKFVNEAQPLREQQYCFPIHEVSDDESSLSDDDEADSSLPEHPTAPDPTTIPSTMPDPTPDLRPGPQTISFHDEEIEPRPRAPDKPLEDAEKELFRWHLRLSHCSFDKLKIMAARGDLPSRLKDCPVPQCPACTYGKMTRRAWRSKNKTSNIQPRTITQPGDCVSVDQMESSSPGFIAQLKGILTRKRYTAATVFVDHFSGLSYVHLQKSLSSVEMLEAKRAFEKFATNYNIQIKHYHADNGRFADNLWLADIARQGQEITFCGVNAHFQNGIAEKRIRDLQEAARTSLLDAKTKWPRAITTELWPYAVCNCNYSHMQTPHRLGKHGGKTPLEVFSGSDIRPNPKHFHPFGCPVYVLNKDLAAGKSISKWLPRARCGIYLGFSPNHSRNVALVLNPQTGLVSPQFHVKFDDMFETVEYPRNKQLDPAEWQCKAGFKTKKFGKVMSTTTAKRAPIQTDTRPPTQQQPDPELPIPQDPDDIWIPEGAGDEGPGPPPEPPPGAIEEPTEEPTRRSE